EQKQEPLGSDRESVHCLAHEAIMQEIAVQNPLVWERLELSVLHREGAEDDNICQQKTRAGGNCFYRAFGLSHLEALLDDSKESQQFKAVSDKSKDVVSQGFPELTTEDFHHTFTDLNEWVEKQPQRTVDHLVIYLRLLPSGDLQQNSKFLEHCIERGWTIRELCQQEGGGRILILALAQALSVSSWVEGMDRGKGSTMPLEGSSPRDPIIYKPGILELIGAS
ncbi:hypothetical protein K5549_020842, partial [Capra hircus]|uniref:Uncharacterized protein n=1 Tax=Capra hircus TaxID=9925 RepID=A0A452DNQ8_CAPHI